MAIMNYEFNKNIVYIFTIEYAQGKHLSQFALRVSQNYDIKLIV